MSYSVLRNLYITHITKNAKAHMSSVPTISVPLPPIHDTPSAPPSSVMVRDSLMEYKLGNLYTSHQLTRFCVLIKAGSRHETESNFGVSHYLRHALMQSNKKDSCISLVRSFGQIGASVYFGGDRDHIMIKGHCGIQYAKHAIEMIGSVLSVPAFFDWEMKRSLQSALIEYDDMMYNSQHARLIDQAHHVAYGSGYGNSLLVNPDFSGKLSSQILAEFHENFVHPHGIVIGCLGQQNLSWQGLRTFKLNKREMFPFKPQKFYSGERRTLAPWKKTHVVVAKPGVKFSPSQKDYVLYLILKEMVSHEDPIWISSLRVSNLIGEALHKNKISEYVDCASSFNLSYQHTGMFGIYLCAPNEHIKRAVEVVCKALKEDLPKYLTPITLERAKRLATRKYVEDDEKPENQVSNFTRQIAFGLEYSDRTKMSNLISAVSIEEFKSFIHKFIDYPAVLTVVGQETSVPRLSDLM